MFDVSLFIGFQPKQLVFRLMYFSGEVECFSKTFYNVQIVRYHMIRYTCLTNLKSQNLKCPCLNH